MTDHDLDLDRAEAAARRYLADEVAAVGFRPLDPDALKPARRPSRRRAGWLVAAACAAAALVAVPLVLRPGGPIAATPEPEPGFAWTKTADSPLSPRFGSLTAWLDGRFYVLGGWSGGPCPPGALCDMPSPELRDGAAYDPADDRWQPIAQAPTGFGRGYSSLTAWGGALYLADWSGDGTLWAYYPGDDRWLQHADPPSWGPLVATEVGVVLLVGGPGAPSYLYQPGADTWTPLPAGPLDACYERQGFTAGAGLLVLAQCAAQPDTGNDLRVSTYDPATQAWTAAVPVDGQVAGDAVHLAGKLVWPDPLTPASSLRSDGILDTATGTWREVDTTAPSGPLAYRAMVGSTPHLVLGEEGLVAANGRLLDVRTAAWVEVPALPGPERWDALAVAGPDAILRCFGYEYTDDSQSTGRFLPQCHLLARPGAPEPTAAPAPPSQTPASGWQWEEVLPAADPVPTDPLLVAANGSYYLMGGYVLDNEIDDVQLHTGRRFDPATGQWRPIADLPQAAVSRPYTLNADVVGTLIYVHISFEETGELWAYDTVADSWRKVNQTDETEHYLGTEDGLVRFRLLGEGPAGPPPQLFDGESWIDLPAPPLVPQPAADVFRLDDHAIGLETDGRVVVLDTASRSWGQPSEEGSTANRRALGAGGAVAFVYPPDNEGEFLPNNKYGLDVVTYRDGSWGHPSVLEQDGGLGSYIGAGPGRWLVVTGNLFDPGTGDWLRLPALPGSDYGWESRIVAATNDSVMTCFPYAVERDRTLTEDGCYLLRLP